jgi:hypothetical protein
MVSVLYSNGTLSTVRPNRVFRLRIFQIWGGGSREISPFRRWPSARTRRRAAITWNACASPITVTAGFTRGYGLPRDRIRSRITPCLPEQNSRAAPPPWLRWFPLNPPLTRRKWRFSPPLTASLSVQSDPGVARRYNCRRYDHQAIWELQPSIQYFWSPGLRSWRVVGQFIELRLV